MFRSIRWRIAIPYIFLLLIVLLSLGAYLSSQFQSAELSELEQELAAQSRLLAVVVQSREAGEVPEAPLDELAREWSEILAARVTIVDAQGTVIGESHEDRAQMDNHLLRPEIQQSLSAGVGKSIRFSNTVGYEMMYVAVPLRADGKLDGFVRLALPLDEIQTRTAHIQRTIIVAAVVALVFVVGLATLIANLTTRPLRNLAGAVQHMSSADLQELITASPRNEVGQIAKSFLVLNAQLRSQIEALQDERTRMAAVLEQMTDGVLIVDERGRVQLINPAAQRLFGVEERQAVGQTVSGVLRHHQLIDLWRQSQQTGESQTGYFELPVRRLILQGVAIPLAQALPGSILLVFQDFTQMRRLENVRRDFISNISHELRTPLASLKALTETLQESALEDPPAARRFLIRMETEVDSLAIMVQELLELSRIESGKVPLQLSPVSPEQLITGAAERLRLQAERAGLNLVIACPPDLPAVLADPNRMEQVIVNLLHNAIKFTPQGGEILLTAMRENGWVRFSVKDSGVGISTEDLPRIFERFFKADRARSGGGTGLGLAISRHLVEAHAGRIWVESVEGRGSTFFFTLPIAS